MVLPKAKEAESGGDHAGVRERRDGLDGRGQNVGRCQDNVSEPGKAKWILCHGEIGGGGGDVVRSMTLPLQNGR